MGGQRRGRGGREIRFEEKGFDEQAVGGVMGGVMGSGALFRPLHRD